ncbi:acyl-CoA N-acyltransferase [Dioszegia hungarica]|uniref:Acyl-CoA N-acyltransferase n=1 Tax=Dioszegia hungarica TaxID=4972 RepID=A0AA38LSS6_9TREE|nr:acyl-CoA N-acyltransferase [Dioszegia hungarica]KAI9632984.1 acyl-CoA N-acyltransferase [Dioszegia hungarica]
MFGPVATPEIQIARVTDPEPRVINYALAAWRELFAPRTNNPTIPIDLAAFRKVYCAAHSGACFLVAQVPPSHRQIERQEKGKVVGILAFLPYSPRFKDNAGALRPELLWSNTKTIEVVRLYVSAEYRGQQIAQKLIGRLVEEAKDEQAEMMYLHTHPFLPGAEQLWRKMGWSVVSRDEDAWESIHMTRRI